MVAASDTLFIVVPIDAAGERLDRFLADASQLEQLSRSQIQKLIGSQNITLEGRGLRASMKLRGGERLRVDIPAPTPLALTPEPMDLRVLFEDADVIALNKPSGLVVHPGAGHPTGTLVHALLAHCDDLSGIGGAARPGIVHRLDRGTSGVIVVAKNDHAHEGLARQFAERTVRKHYEAWVIGVPSPRGRIETGYARHPTDRKRFTGKVDGGRRALTQYTVAASSSGIARLEVDLGTGRTHQIRVHLSELGHPVVGDPMYGGTKLARIEAGPVRDAAAALGRQALHAARLVISHPRSGEVLDLRAARPPDLEQLDAIAFGGG